VKSGELLREMDKAKGAPGNQHTGPVERNDRSKPTLSEIGVTKDQSSAWQKLAAVSDADFEAALAGSEKPTLAHIVAAAAERARADAAWQAAAEAEEARLKLEQQLREQSEARRAAEAREADAAAAAEKARQKKEAAKNWREWKRAHFGDFYEKRRRRRQGRSVTARDRQRIARILGMLGSDQDGEALAAARQAEIARVRLGVTWHELLGT
jgi:hypothetical protein